MKRVNFSREDNVSRERKRRPRTPSLMKLLSHVEILSLSLSLYYSHIRANGGKFLKYRLAKFFACHK